MNKQSKILFAFILSIAAMASAACGDGGTNTASNAKNANVANANPTAPANANTLETTKTAEAATTNAAPNITPIVHSYYEALKKKDDALLRSVLSAEFIKSVEADMKVDKKSGSLAAYMSEFDEVPEKPIEVRNEKIDGNNAVAELKGGVYVNWTPLAFVNEGGKWKFTGGSPVLK
ncbi:MAG TPA: hypothetical protein VNA22_03030 [Pyrinomonadaceae bacterium]|nr:hypothetical protein [Pyrinomonadaceae bacterium]